MTALNLLVAALPHPAEEEIRRKIKDILSRPEFSAKWDMKIWQQLREFLGKIFKWLGGLYDGSPILFWLLLFCCVTLLALLLAHIIFTVRRILFWSSKAKPEKPEEQRRRLSVSYREAALNAARRQEFTEAIRCLFLSLVYRFDENGRVSFHNAWTNREYLSLFADRRQLHSGLKVFVDTLDDFWYGQRPTDQDRYKNCLDLYESCCRA